MFSSFSAYLTQALRIYLEEVLSMSSCINGKLCSRHRRCLAGMFRKMRMWFFIRDVQSECKCQILLSVFYRGIEIIALFPTVCVCVCKGSDKCHRRAKRILARWSLTKNVGEITFCQLFQCFIKSPKGFLPN